LEGKLNICCDSLESKETQSSEAFDETCSKTDNLNGRTASKEINEDAHDFDVSASNEVCGASNVQPEINEGIIANTSTPANNEDQCDHVENNATQNVSPIETYDTATNDTSTNTIITDEENVQIHREISDLRNKISTQTGVISKSEVINAFLTSSSHQLTYHGLEKLHTHLSEEDLCVFFRNNHFATLTKHDNTLYLLVTDLGYANTPEIVWEKLDAIDGDTEYTNEVFCRPQHREELTPAPGPSINPELLLAQRSQAESDYALALALSEGRATSQRMDDDEGQLIAAATEASLKSYHHQSGTVAVETDSKDTQKSQIDIDREVALAFQKEQEKIDRESERLARQLQEMEYAQHSQPAARATRPVNTVSSSRGNSTAASSNCVIS
jgi:hypothetical protein